MGSRSRGMIWDKEARCWIRRCGGQKGLYVRPPKWAELTRRRVPPKQRGKR